MRCPSCEAPLEQIEQTVGHLMSCPECQAQFASELARDPGGVPQLSFSRIGKPGGDEVGARVRELFQVLGVLGRGGQGAVYRVRPRGTERDYALKYVDITVEEPSDVFNREQELTSVLAHPGIVQLFAAGRDGDRAYAVYEIVEGRTLADLIADGPLPIPRAVDLALQAFAGLAHSHDAGVVHRDIKPGNILVAQGDIAKIADFGIGRLVGPGAKLGEEFSVQFMGTPGYAPPEQIRGQGVIPASDVYAMGMTLYKCLAGCTAYEADSILELMSEQCLKDAADVRTHRPEVPPGLAAFLSSCLERVPAKRPATGGVAVDRLKAEALAAGLPVPLTLEPLAPERMALSSRPGLAAAGARLAASLVVLALPFAVLAFADGALGGLHAVGPLVMFWLVWLPALAALSYRAGLDVSADGAAARDWGLFPEFAHAGAEKLAALALLMVSACAVRLAAGSGLTYVGPFVLVCHALAAVLFFGKTAQQWVECALTSGVTMRADEGLLDLAGPAGARARLDDGPEARLPARLRVPRGAHRLTIVFGKTSREFRFVITEPGLHAARFTASGDGVIQAKDVHRRRAAATPRASLLPAVLGLATAAGAVSALVAYPLGVRCAGGAGALDTSAAGPAARVIAPDEPADAKARELFATAERMRAQRWTPRAVTACRESLAIETSFATRTLLVRCLAESGQVQEAWSELERTRLEAGNAAARRKVLDVLAQEIAAREQR